MVYCEHFKKSSTGMSVFLPQASESQPFNLTQGFKVPMSRLFAWIESQFCMAYDLNNVQRIIFSYNPRINATFF